MKPRQPMPPHHIVDLLRMLHRADAAAVRHDYEDRLIRISRPCLDSITEALQELLAAKRSTKRRGRYLRHCDERRASA